MTSVLTSIPPHRCVDTVECVYTSHSTVHHAATVPACRPLPGTPACETRARDVRTWKTRRVTRTPSIAASARGRRRGTGSRAAVARSSSSSTVSLSWPSIINGAGYYFRPSLSSLRRPAIFPLPSSGRRAAADTDGRCCRADRVDAPRTFFRRNTVVK